MIKSKTTSGFEYQVDERLMQNFRFVRLLREWQNNNLAQVDVLDFMLGKEQAEALQEHVADKEGFVNSQKIADEMNEMFETLSEKSKEIKN